jgi:penicillin-binding protein 1C
MDAIRLASNPAVPTITYPGDGTLIAIDPDIPADRQRVFFEVQSDRAGAEWLLDGETIDAAAGWRPTAGTHVLALVDDAGALLDRVRFTVRGR